MYKKKINLADMSNYQLGIIYGIGSEIKKVQTVHNDKTGYIQYTSLNEIVTIRNYIKGNPCNKSYWDIVDEKIKEPRKK